MTADRVWYAAYGSNLFADRFAVYLEGGVYGGGRAHHGARDRAPAAGSRVIEVPHQLRFALHSERWGGGVAFLDPAAGSGSAIVRCWDVTAEQFSDVAAQENGLVPGELDIDPVGVAAADGGVLDVTDRWYGRALHLGQIDGCPVLTFTCATNSPASSPGAPYVEVVGRGLLECGRPLDAVVAYLLAAPGVALGWSDADLAELLSAERPDHRTER